MCDCLWSDPSDNFGRYPSKRGISVMFGPDVTKKFIEENDLSKYQNFQFDFNLTYLFNLI